MLRFTKNIFIVLSLLVLGSSCKKNKELTTLSELLSKDNSDSKILREYKTWEMAEAVLVRAGLPTLTYKKGQPIQGNFDASKISFVFSSNKTFQGTDEKGKPENGQWLIDDTNKTLQLVTSSSTDLYKILNITKTNLEFKGEDSFDQKVATVTYKMAQKN